jgi:hypothetical protein
MWINAEVGAEYYMRNQTIEPVAPLGRCPGASSLAIILCGKLSGKGEIR